MLGRAVSHKQYTSLVTLTEIAVNLCVAHPMPLNRQSCVVALLHRQFPQPCGQQRHRICQFGQVSLKPCAQHLYLQDYKQNIRPNDSEARSCYITMFDTHHEMLSRLYVQVLFHRIVVATPHAPSAERAATRGFSGIFMGLVGTVAFMP